MHGELPYRLVIGLEVHVQLLTKDKVILRMQYGIRFTA
jgi:Asp-tRNA(Asn)/Glu-tRNA(Gln) amidotransferase B subunit